MLIGYLLGSTGDPALRRQRQALKAAGCARIFADRVPMGRSGAQQGLQKAVAACRAGDVLVVWRLERLARSLAHLAEIVSELRAREVDLLVLEDCIDTRGAAGPAYFHLLTVLGAFEKQTTRERTQTGLAEARGRGSELGRPQKLTARQKKDICRRLARGEPGTGVARHYGVSTATISRVRNHPEVDAEA